MLHGTALAASEIVGRIIAVADGDSITVLDAAHHQHRIRIAGIDAPERRQPYGERSKQHLAALAHGRSARVVWSKRDRYGRIVGRVMAAECEAARCPYSIDVAMEQLRAGLAWHYRRYAYEQPLAEREQYAAMEDAARAAGIGLWREADAIAPWQFRRRDAVTVRALRPSELRTTGAARRER